MLLFLMIPATTQGCTPCRFKSLLMIFSKSLGKRFASSMRYSGNSLESIRESESFSNWAACSNEFPRIWRIARMESWAPYFTAVSLLLMRLAAMEIAIWVRSSFV